MLLLPTLPLLPLSAYSYLPFTVWPHTHSCTGKTFNYRVSEIDRQTKRPAHYLLVATASRQVACGSGAHCKHFNLPADSRCAAQKPNNNNDNNRNNAPKAHQLHNGKKKEEEGGTQRGRSSQKMATKMVHKSDKWRTQKTPFHIRCARRKCPKGHTHTNTQTHTRTLAKGLSNTGSGTL